MNTAEVAEPCQSSANTHSYITTGTVLSFAPLKGYGFIHCDTRNVSVFVYHLNIEMDGFRLLRKGEKVEFKVMQRKKGPAAFNVRRLAT